MGKGMGMYIHDGCKFVFHLHEESFFVSNGDGVLLSVTNKKLREM